MDGGDWYDDSGYRDAVRRADRAARWGWAVIAAVITVVVGVFVLAAAAVLLLFLMFLFSYVYAAG